jgi:hypothetical protein
MAGVTQTVFALALVLPIFLLFAGRRPKPDLLTLGLPFEVIDVNLSSVLLAIAIGGLPLLLAGIVFAHVAAPLLMRRKVPLITLGAAAVGGWFLGLLSVIIGYGALVGLLRLNALDRVSSMYVGATTLRLLLGDYSLVLVAALGILVVSVTWTLLLRLQARGWKRLRRVPLKPQTTRKAVVGRRCGGGTTVWWSRSAYRCLVGLLSNGIAMNGSSQTPLQSMWFAGAIVASCAVLVSGLCIVQTCQPGERP